jgi:hypothetical protein
MQCTGKLPFTVPAQWVAKKPQVHPEMACLPATAVMLKDTLRLPTIRYRIGGVKQHKKSGSIRVSCNGCRSGSTIDFLGLEGLVRMAVTLHGNQLAYPASARMIALAVQNKVDCLSRLRTDERVV